VPGHANALSDIMAPRQSPPYRGIASNGPKAKASAVRFDQVVAQSESMHQVADGLP